MPRPPQTPKDTDDVLSKATAFYAGKGLRPANWKDKREPNSFDSKVGRKAIDFCKGVTPWELNALARCYRNAKDRLGLSATYCDQMMDELGKLENEVAYQIAGVGVILFWYEEKVAP